MQVVADFVVVVFARAEPPESFGARAHLRRELLVREVGVALEVHTRNGDPTPFEHVEDHAHAGRVVLVDVNRRGVREIVALRVIERIDPRARARHGGGIERTGLRELHFVVHAVIGQALHAAHRPLHEQRPLVHMNQQDVLAVHFFLGEIDAVELPAAIERLDRALDVAVVDRMARREAAGLNDADGGVAVISDHGDRVGDGRLAIQRRPRPPGLCGAQTRGDGGETQ